MLRPISILGFCITKRVEKKMQKNATKKAIEINPKHAISHYNLGVLYGQIGRRKDAEECYKKAKENFLRPK